MAPKKDGWWFVTTPYIDAYQNAEWVSASKGSTSGGRHLGIGFEEFENHMMSQARNWGEQSLGATVLQGKKQAKTDDGRLVLAIGTWDDQYWVTVVKHDPTEPYWFSSLEVIPFVWEKEWDVT